MNKILEAVLSNVKKTVTFSKSEWNSPFIVNTLNALEKVGYSKLQVETECNADMRDIEDMQQYAPKLVETMYQNRVESAVFSFMWKKADPFKLQAQIKSPKFQRPMMQRLLNEMSGANNGEFFPLRSIVEKTTLRHPMLEYSADNPKYKGITTAAATPSGNFIFDEGFMQSLINYAFLKKVKPSAQYFKSNGGPIPDEYCYAEFVLAHELMHYTHSDFHRQHTIHQPNHTLINWAGDMRSNYILVKSGYSQLPMGLYSNEFNYDKYKDFNALYEDIKREYEKIPQDKKKEADQTMDDMSNDDHSEGQKEGASQQEKGKAEQVSKDQMDEHGKGQDEAVEKGKENADDKSAAEQRRKENSGKAGQPGTEAGAPQTLDTSDVKPTISWRQMIAKFVTSVKPVVSTSWSKISRRAAGTALAVSSHGAGAIKPGMYKVDSDNVNLAIVLDSSGSMSGVAKQVLAETTNLVKKHFPRADFFIIVFSNVMQLYRCNLAKNTAIRVENMKDTKGTSIPLTQLLSTYDGGGTVFKSVANPLIGIMNQNYNVLLITDSDIIGGENLTVFTELLMKYRRLINVILSTAQDYEMVAKTLPVKPNNLTHMN